MRLTARVALLFATCLALFGMLGMRLWFVQIAEGAEAAEVTDNQSWVYLATPAPRGDIRDSKGQLLATSRFVPAIEVDRHLVAPDQREYLIQRLSSLLAIPAAEIEARYDAAGINGQFVLATIDTDEAYRINEQLRDFPGVRIKKVPDRIYLVGESMAHMIGHLGLPTKDDLDTRPDLDLNTRIGKLGVEQVYDSYIQGTPGELAYRVQRAEITEQRPVVPATPGDTVYLTSDLDLQLVVESALAQGIVLSNEWKAEQRRLGRDDAAKNETVRGAAVVMDARTGAIKAMASYPTFDPAIFVERVDPTAYDVLSQERAFLNLAVSGLYPPASAFKAVTYLTALEQNVPLPSGVEGVDPGSKVVNCDGTLELPGLSDGSPQIFRDWYAPAQKGWLDLSSAFEQSCNIYFWSVALGIYRSWDETPRETVLQDLARELGLGSKTGIDLSGDAAGIVPDRQLFKSWQELQLEDEEAPRLLHPSRLELSDPWFGGDLMNTAIGQGNVTATPLQMAVAYAAMVNGGTVWRPYVVQEIRDRSGEMVYANTPTVVRQVELDQENTARLRRDMNRVVTSGTAAAAFAGFGDSLSQVGGKTGTGQSVSSKDNHAWFAGLVGVDDPKYIVMVLIDEGGSGGAVAAPVARQIMQYLQGEELDPITAGAAAQ